MKLREQISEIAQLHRKTLPHTWNSQRGEKFIVWLYRIVNTVGYIKTVQRERKIVGVMSGGGRLILTLCVDPDSQRQGVGKQLIESLQGRIYVYTEECTTGFYYKMGFRKLIRCGRIVLLVRK